MRPPRHPARSALRLSTLAAAGVLGALAAGHLIERLRFEPLPEGTTADLVVVEKGARRLTLYRQGAVLKTYRIALGRVPAGAKHLEGDGKTPEGRYVIDWRKRDSRFHRALHVSYPSPEDTRAAAAQGHSAGSAIMIHGLRNGLGFLGPLHRLLDWTEGCIAVTDLEIEEIWRAVPNGTPIDLRP